MDYITATLVAGLGGAIMGAGIGFLASTYGASFSQDRQRQIRAIGISRALQIEMQRLRDGLAPGPGALLEPGPSIGVPSMSSWVQELFAEIAMDSADVLADIMRLIAQLDNMRTLSQAYPAAATTATAAQADLLKEQFRSGPGFTGVGEVVWSDAVNAARRQFDWAQRQADILANGVRETHTASIKTIDRILAELQQLASRPIPERVPWPTPPELRSGS